MKEVYRTTASSIHLQSTEQSTKNNDLTLIFLFFFKDEFKERPAIASAISSITNYSSTIPQAPGDPDAKPVEKVSGFIHENIKWKACRGAVLILIYYLFIVNLSLYVQEIHQTFRVKNATSSFRN